MSSRGKVITSLVEGKGFCLVVLWPETARRETRCPLYRVRLFFMRKVPTTTKIVTDSITKLLLNSSQIVIDQLLASIPIVYLLHYKLLLTRKLLQTSLQLFTYFITNCY